jgi:hypothetical protein
MPNAVAEEIVSGLSEGPAAAPLAEPNSTLKNASEAMVDGTRWAMAYNLTPPGAGESE